MVSCIVAMDKNRVIGKKGQLPWRMPADLKRFKDITMGHPVIMGRKTFESIGKPLGGRKNIVLSKNPDLKILGCSVLTELPQALGLFPPEEEVFIIGGAQVYAQALSLAHKLYITVVHTTVADGDAYFPEIKSPDWHIVEEVLNPLDTKNPYSYTYLTLIRKNYE